MHIFQEKIQELAHKFMKGEATPEEEALLFHWYNNQQEQVLTDVTEPLPDEKAVKDRMFRNIAEAPVSTFRANHKIVTWRKFRFAAAAAVILFMAAGVYLWSARNVQMPREAVAVATTVKDMSPGTDKAILTLANGETVLLDEAHNGTIGHEAKADIIKQGAQVSYVSKGEPAELSYNTIATPRKGQYHLVLADGTGVWLDAESSIRFPVSFPGNERRVEVSGQAYFEVAKDAAKPFHVKLLTNNADIQVLGTNFNIMAYENEGPAKATLLEGAIKVQTVSASSVLQPGQQAQMKTQGSIHLVKQANLDQVMAWKNGMFHLGTTSIEEIMRQVTRWYDAEVAYEGDISRLKFSGEVSRKQHVSELLKILEATGTVAFKTEGNKITVVPKK